MAALRPVGLYIDPYMLRALFPVLAGIRGFIVICGELLPSGGNLFFVQDRFIPKRHAVTFYRANGICIPAYFLRPWVAMGSNAAFKFEAVLEGPRFQKLVIIQSHA